MPHARNLFINLGLLVASLALVIGFGEISLRLLGIEKGRVVPPPLYQRSTNPNISYELKPNMNEYAFRSTITTNALGFRSPELDGERPVIAVLGDSITFGYGVENEETLPARLRQILPNYDVINAGVPGYSLTQERATYRTKLAPLNPDFLILVFYWNDLQDPTPAELSPDGNLYPRGQVPLTPRCAPLLDGPLAMIPGKCWLDTHSAIYRVMKKLAMQKAMKRDQADQVEMFKDDREYEYVTDTQLQRYADDLASFARELPPDLPKLFVIWPERPLHFELRPQLKKIAEERGFTVLDLYDTFGNNPETLNWDTVHPHPDTLKKAAKEVYEALERHEMTN